jgi:hypothetical protein
MPWPPITVMTFEVTGAPAGVLGDAKLLARGGAAILAA